MSWSTTSDVDRFAAAADGYLCSHAAANTLLLSAESAARHGHHPAREDLLFGWWEPSDGSGARGAFLHDPAVPLLIAGRVPEMAAGLAGTLARLGRPVCGVDGPVEAADAFAAAWQQRSGMAVRAHRNCRVYRLAAADAEARPPGTSADAKAPGSAVWRLPWSAGPAGRLRTAAGTDRALLTDWLTAYCAESGERIGTPSDVAEDLIGYGGAVFWEVPQRATARIRVAARDAAQHLVNPRHRDAAPLAEPGYQPVAMAALTRAVAGVVRISLVYTPPERRRNGYAAAVTFAVSHAALAARPPAATRLPAAARPPAAARAPVIGCPPATQVVLITDRNRPDRRVVRLGYELVGERTVLRFGPPTGPQPRLRSSGPMPRLPTGPVRPV